MTKKQHGNREPKKPRQPVRAPATPAEAGLSGLAPAPTGWHKTIKDDKAAPGRG